MNRVYEGLWRVFACVGVAAILTLPTAALGAPTGTTTTTAAKCYEVTYRFLGHTIHTSKCVQGFCWRFWLTCYGNVKAGTYDCCYTQP